MIPSFLRRGETFCGRNEAQAGLINQGRTHEKNFSGNVRDKLKPKNRAKTC